LFINTAKLERPKTRDDVPTHVLAPAYILSEMRIAFQIGFLIYIPFLIIDMVVASTLMAMGMMMLPPIFVSLPFKIIMFVLADGWYLLLGTLVRSFQ
jgi:flagellar biosynthetic protein FliP